jgi:5-methylcytosine-specific restriction endonuclease McrA
MAVCRKCERDLPQSSFGKYTNKRDGTVKVGYRKVCQTCRGKQIDPAKRRAATLRWREAHPDRVYEAQRAYAKRNPDKVLAWRRAHHKSPKTYATNARRRARRAAATTYTVAPRDLRRLYSSPCWACGSTDQVQWDHIIPLTRGGSHGIGNALPLCKPCNCSKHGQLLAEWRYRAMRGGQ